MAAPKYVPSPVQQRKYYQSTRKTKHSSGVLRPAEVFKHNVNQEGMGHPGPDQGYALRLVKQFKDKVFLVSGEHWEDASEVVAEEYGAEKKQRTSGAQGAKPRGEKRKKKGEEEG